MKISVCLVSLKNFFLYSSTVSLPNPHMYKMIFSRVFTFAKFHVAQKSMLGNNLHWNKHLSHKNVMKNWLTWIAWSLQSSLCLETRVIWVWSVHLIQCFVYTFLLNDGTNKMASNSKTSITKMLGLMLQPPLHTTYSDSHGLGSVSW